MLLASCLIAVAGYAALPWWLPTSIIRGAIADDIANQTGLDVKVGQVSVGWSSGVTVSKIQIFAPPAQGGEMMCTVESARSDFSPLKYLFAGRIGWLELDRPKVLVRIDQSGDVNLAPLTRIQPKAEVERISIRQAVAAVKFPGQDRLLRLNIGDMQITQGRPDRIARVTMSAALDQPGQPAGVSLNVAPGLSEQATTAEASFRFANVDLGQFNLPGLLHLPLERFDGRCGGIIKLKLNQQAQVDQVDLNLEFCNLFVQAYGEPPAPQIDKVALAISASFDPLTGWLDIRSASLNMPGLAMEGRFNAGADLRKGSWEALESFQMAGTIEPAKLAWLAEQLDLADLPVRIDGPVGIGVQIAHTGPAVGIQFSIKADQAAISLKIAPDTPIKPAGARFSVDLDGTLDERMWNLGIDKSVIRIGQTVFEGKGTIRSTKKILDAISGDDEKPPPTLADVVDILSQVSWQGSMKLENVRHVLEVRPELGMLDEILQLDKPIAGDVNFDGPGGRKFDASLSLDLKTGRSKDGDHLALRTSGRIESDKRLLADGLVELSIGRTDFALRDMNLAVTAPARPAGKAALRATASLNCGDVASLVELLTAKRAGHKGLPADMKITGALAGHLDVQLFGDRDLAILGLDFTNLNVLLGRWFVKPAGQKADLEFAMESINVAGGSPLIVSFDADCRQSRLSASFTAANPQKMAAGQGELKYKFISADAAALTSACPAFKNLSVPLRLAGPFEFSGTARLSPDDIKIAASLNADSLAVDLANGLRVKRPMTSLGAALQASMNIRPSGVSLKDARANLTFGHSRLYANVEFCEFPGELAGLMARLYPLKFIKAGGTVCADDALLDLLPEGRQFAKNFNLSATDGIGLRLILGQGAAENEANLAMQVDADNLSLFKDNATLADFGIAGDPLGLLQLGAICKTPRQPARAAMFVSAKCEAATTGSCGAISKASIGASLQLNHARLAVESQFTSPRPGASAATTTPASQSAPSPSGRPAAWPVEFAGERFDIGAISGRLEASGLDSLAAFAPKLTAAGLAGGMIADWTLDPAETATGRLNMHFDGLAWRLGGKQIFLNGGLTAADVAINVPNDAARQLVSGQPGLGWPGAVITDGLEFRIGKNRGWLIADLSGWPDCVSGDAAVFLSRFDMMDVQNWAAGKSGDSTAAPQPADKARLTFQQKQEIISQADQALAAARKYLSRSDLNVLIRAESLITYDQDVDRFYEERNLVSNITVRQGHVRIVNEFGLNGGCDKLILETNLADAEPVLLSDTTLRGVIAEENIQPQLAKFFPGNTVTGDFDRTENVTYPLRDMIAQSIDSRVHAIPTGHSKMVARDGYVLGRAAPQFIANIFPGLNLARYEYKTMTSFGNFLPDGTAKNDMIFSGQSYDMYMEGTTDVKNFGEYEIGLILLGQDADWNHAWKQLRIPILKFKGTIEGGKILNQEVSYFWPTETAFVIFLKNNIVYRLWANLANPAEGKK